MTSAGKSVKTRGIVLGHVKYGETSIIVSIFTREIGLQSYIVNGVRSTKRKDMLPLLFPLNIVDLEASYRPKTNLQRLTEVHVGEPLTSIPYNQSRRSIAFFIAEVLSHSLREDGPDDSLFDFIHDSILALDAGTQGESNFHLFFMYNLAYFLGFAPDFTETEKPYFDLVEGVFVDRVPMHGFTLMNDDRRLWIALGTATQDNLSTIASNRADRQRLVEILCEYYSCHISSFQEPRSQTVLQQLF